MSQSQSLWMTETQFSSYSPLNQDIHEDVCVIGAGIAGLTSAYVLSQMGKKVVVLEAEDQVGGNQSMRTTAHLTNVLDDRYYELEKLFGEKGSRLAAESHARAISFIESTALKEGIQCNFERLKAYLFMPPQSDLEILDQELEAAARAGLEVNRIARAPLTYNTGPCLEFSNQAQFNPGIYLQGLAEAIERQGGKIYCRTRAAEFHDGKNSSVVTAKGHKITADAIIVATNTPVNDRVFMHTKQAAYRTYVIVAKIPSGSVNKALYYDTLDPYHYVRVAENPQAKEEFLIIGGEDHRTGENDHPEQCYEKLEKWARERFPTMQEITHKWSGQILESMDSLAFIGKNPLNENIYIVTGDSGDGMTYGTIGALLIADLINGKENAWETLYKPARKNLNAIKEYAQENLNTLAQYRDWFTAQNKETIQSSSGAVIQCGLKKIAAYRDQNDELHTLCAVCPHLGGIVRWNSAENTWDCPCHGSRFTVDGKVINGPANSDLKREDICKDP